MSISRIAIIGSGTMGRGIAVAAATNGIDVSLLDISEEMLEGAKSKIRQVLEKAVLKGKIAADQVSEITQRIKTTSRYEELHSIEVAIEAAPETMAVKKRIFESLAEHCPPSAILASNTSSLSITAVSADVSRPERVAGMHFFNPANIMKLVEVVQSRFTSEETMTTLCQLAEQMGKTPARVKDTPGFIVNRVARSFYSESLRILEENVATVEDIDRILVGHGFKMGPFTLMDLIGNDVNFEVTRTLYESYHGEPRYRPSQIQESLVSAGLLGKKTGKGFYDYTKET